MTLTDDLVAIAKYAPDLIRTAPRAPLWEVVVSTPEHLRNPSSYGPLLFWDESFNWAAGLYDPIATGDDNGVLKVKPHIVSRLLPGLMCCCDKRGWYWEVRRKHDYAYHATISPNWDRSCYEADGDTPTEALAAALAFAVTIEPPAVLVQF